MRIQLAVPNNHFVSPQVPIGCSMHGTTMIFFVAMPVMFGFGNSSCAADDWRARHGVSGLNAFSFWVSALCGLLMASAISSMGFMEWVRAGRWLVRLCSADREGLLAGA